MRKRRVGVKLIKRETNDVFVGILESRYPAYSNIIHFHFFWPQRKLSQFDRQVISTKFGSCFLKFPISEPMPSSIFIHPFLCHFYLSPFYFVARPLYFSRPYYLIALFIFF